VLSERRDRRRQPPGFALVTLTILSIIVVVPLFLTWLYLVGRNAGAWGPQRRAQGSAIGGWFVPVMFLWFALRASRPGGQPSRSPTIVISWWICWLLAWFTGFHDRHDQTTTIDGTTLTNVGVGFQLGSNKVSAVFTAAAAVLGAVMVHLLGRMQRASMTTPAAYGPL
jgi:hypothetical protein